jgi:hypothetical protein
MDAVIQLKINGRIKQEKMRTLKLVLPKCFKECSLFYKREMNLPDELYIDKSELHKLGGANEDGKKDKRKQS